MNPLFESRQEEAIVTFICENEPQWNKDHWDDFRRQVACCKFGIEYGKQVRDKHEIHN
jgi:hypothetical protein